MVLLDQGKPECKADYDRALKLGSVECPCAQVLWIGFLWLCSCLLATLSYTNAAAFQMPNRQLCAGGAGMVDSGRLRRLFVAAACRRKCLRAKWLH
jgi:hypothetical protein